MKRARRLFIALVTVLSLLAVAAPADATITIQITKGRRGKDVFFPRHVVRERSAPTLWSSNDGRAHSITTAGATFAVPAGGTGGGASFTVIGTFPVRCTIHKEKAGSIAVPLEVDDPSKPAGSVFTFTWANGPVNDPDNIDLQFKRVGKRKWLPLATDQQGTSGPFVVSTVPGNYLVRARFQNATTAFGFSPPLQLNLT
jgi:hypothetical protein